MGTFATQFDTLTIASGGTTSGATVRGALDDADAVGVTFPGTPTGGITVEVNPSDADAALWVTLKSAGSDVTVGAASGIVLVDFPFARLRLKSSAAEGAARTFYISKFVRT